MSILAAVVDFHSCPASWLRDPEPESLAFSHVSPAKSCVLDVVVSWVEAKSVVPLFGVLGFGERPVTFFALFV